MLLLRKQMERQLNRPWWRLLNRFDQVRRRLRRR
jgi:hypothetical protein